MCIGPPQPTKSGPNRTQVRGAAIYRRVTRYVVPEGTCRGWHMWAGFPKIEPGLGSGATEPAKLETRLASFGCVLVELHFPVGATAEWFVFALAAAAEGEVIRGSPLKEISAVQLSPTANDIGPVGSEGDHGVPAPDRILLAVDRITQRT